MDLSFSERKKFLPTMQRRHFSQRLKRAWLLTASGHEMQLRFGPGISLLAGGNGAGKSSALAALMKCFGGSGDEITRATPDWLRGAMLSGESTGGEWAVSFGLYVSASVGIIPEVRLINASSATESISQRFRQDAASVDLLEGIDGQPLAGDLVALLRYVLRRDYTEILVFEISAFSENDEVIPLFKVSCSGLEYDSTYMGRGELAALYLFWVLSRTSPSTICLLEEPESHLAVYSQQRLAEALVYLSGKHGLNLVVSTHAPAFIEKIPIEHTNLLNLLPIASSQHMTSLGAVVHHLGIPTTDPTRLLLVEDKVASILLVALLRACAPDLHRTSVVYYCQNGESGVTRVLEEVRRNHPSGQFSVLAVYDGDQRAKLSGQVPHIAFLPGELSPEEVLRDLLEQWWAGKVADWSPGGSPDADRLRLALERTQGLDHHDWVTEVAKEFGGTAQLIDQMVELIQKQYSEQVTVLLGHIGAGS